MTQGMAGEKSLPRGYSGRLGVVGIEAIGATSGWQGRAQAEAAAVHTVTTWP